jgi:hypothetical protein
MKSYSIEELNERMRKARMTKGKDAPALGVCSRPDEKRRRAEPKEGSAGAARRRGKDGS